MRTALALVVLLVAASVTADQPRAGPVARPYTLLKAPGTIEAFAQDGGRVAWLTRSQTASGRGCRWSLHVRSLRKPRTATTRVPNGCTTVDSDLQLVLAGHVAAWRRIQGAGNLELDADVWTAVAGAARAHRADRLHATWDLDRGERQATLPIAAGDALIVYDGEHDDRNPPRREVSRIVKGTAHRLFGFDRAFGLDVHGGLVATLGRETPIGPAVSHGEVWSSAGVLLANFRAIGEPQDVALGGAAVVALTAVQGGAVLSVFDVKTGRLLRELPVQAGSRLAGRGASGRWVVFHAGWRIIALDVSSGGLVRLATARTPPIGLTVSGRRVAWAEPGGSASRVRAATLPG